MKAQDDPPDEAWVVSRRKEPATQHEPASDLVRNWLTEDAALPAVAQEAEKPIGRSHVADVAYDFARYYVAGGGCSNCGGLPHMDTCFVGRFVVALALDTLTKEPATPPPALLAKPDDQPEVVYGVPLDQQVASLTERVRLLTERQAALLALVSRWRHVAQEAEKPQLHTVDYLQAYGEEESTLALTRKDRDQYQFWSGWLAALDRIKPEPASRWRQIANDSDIGPDRDWSAIATLRDCAEQLLAELEKRT